MEVIAHQTPRVDLPVGFFAGLAEGCQEQLAVFGAAEDLLLMVAAIHDEVDGAGVLDSDFSGHGARMEEGGIRVKANGTILRTDPFSDPFSFSVHHFSVVALRFGCRPGG